MWRPNALLECMFGPFFNAGWSSGSSAIARDVLGLVGTNGPPTLVCQQRSRMLISSKQERRSAQKERKDFGLPRRRAEAR
jgi:hypothetical protein